MAQRLEYTVLDLIESATRNAKAQPLNLGGIAGAGGGVGGPPGGFIGWLPQTRVAYDEDEIASSGTPASGMSLLDNLNHIRYRLGAVESGILIVDDWDGSPTIQHITELTFSGAIVTQLSPGHALVVVSGGVGASLTVEEVDGSPVVTNVDRIIFSGATVTDLGSGDVRITISGGGGLDTAAGDARYLKLDASNDPITGTLTIDVAASLVGLEIYTDGNSAEALYTANGSESLSINHYSDDSTLIDQHSESIYRYSIAAGGGFLKSAFFVYDDITDAVFSGGTLRHELNGNMKVDINPYAAPAGTMMELNSVNALTASGKLVSLKNQGTEEFYVTGSGVVNIPTGATYNINGSPHTHDGWNTGIGTWSYSSADSPTFIISINADVTTLIGAGDRIKITQSTGGTKYFIVTVVGNYSGGATLITVYGGTDYTLNNESISSPYYSHVKCPFGFPTSPAKWTVELSDTSSRTQGSPSAGTWYNPGSLSISIPIGLWRTECIVSLYTTINGGAQSVFFTLSTANNTESDVDFTGFSAFTPASNGIWTFYAPIYKAKILSIASKTSYYLNIKTANTGVATIGITVDLSKTFVRAICAYL